MDATSTLLCNSYFCRLCGQENKNGRNIFATDENSENLKNMINTYLPLKVEDDGKYPKTICPGCTIQLEATKFFLDLIIAGQKKLREMLLTQQEILFRQEKQRIKLEEALKNINPTSSVETYTIQSDETGEQFLIQIYAEGPLFPPDHELAARLLDKPKKKRGRKPKAETEAVTKENESRQEPEVADEQEEEYNLNGTRKRRRKIPSRYREAVQGKELEKILKEEGVVDEDSDSSPETATEESPVENQEEVIGRLESKDGEHLGELIITKGIRSRRNNNTDEPKKRRKFRCSACLKEFLHYGRYLLHKKMHNGEQSSPTEVNQTEELATYKEHEDEAEKVNKDTTTEPPVNENSIQEPSRDPLQEELTIKNENSDDEKGNNISNQVVCDICKKSFSSKQNYEVHFKAIHQGEKPFSCSTCGMKFSYSHSLKMHLIKHKRHHQYSCEVCKKNFNHPSSLVYHREAEHNNGRRFICNICNKSFKHRQLLQRHQLVHSSERPYKCSQCSASFKSKANLLNHGAIHTGVKAHVCNVCGQSFAHKTSLTLHLRWHRGDKPYSCDFCQKQFSQKGNLLEHRRIHTGEKPFHCEHCDRKFTTSSQFKLHSKRHTGEKPWHCGQCYKTFLHKETWRCHVRRHLNERPFKCSICSKSFTENWSLKKHERLHTGVKPYVCNVCTKGFADVSNLTKHRRIHDQNRLSKSSNPILESMVEKENGTLYVSSEPSDIVVHLVEPDNSESTIEAESEALAAVQQTVDDMQLQHLLDQDGNPLTLSTPDGQQIKVVATVENGQEKLHGVLPDGTLLAINFDPESKDIVDENQEVSDQASAEMSQLLNGNMEFLTENPKLDGNILITSTDDQNVCFVATYNMEDSLNTQYLAMP